MQIKAQPWFHSWYGDLMGLHFVPLVFAFLAFFKWPPFTSDPLPLATFIFVIAIIDWGHIFAQWPRIYSNPLESGKDKFIYIGLYVLSIMLVATYLQYGERLLIHVFLIYFVVFHFIKQHFGLIRIYSKTDGNKSKVDSVAETILCYSTMVVPFIYWHVDFPDPQFYWVRYLFKGPYSVYLFYSALIVYGISFVFYAVAEYKRTLRNNLFNIPKNIAILAAAVGWGAISIASDVPQLIFFTVVLTHDLSYTFIVWVTGRRDKILKDKTVPWYSSFSLPGVLLYSFLLVFFSQLVFVLSTEISGPVNENHFLFGTLFNNFYVEDRWIQNIAWGMYFGTQAHHYFIDRYLWKKEKDLAYMLRVNKA